MYLIDIQIKQQPTQAQLQGHRDWFSNQFNQGNFLLAGPSQTKKLAGIIIARDMSREQLDKILAEDEFYPNGATYKVNQFKAGLINVQGLKDEAD